MIRKIIRIDKEKCNGCGACADANFLNVKRFASQVRFVYTMHFGFGSTFFCAAPINVL